MSADVDDDVVAVLERVDVVEDEGGVELERRGDAARLRSTRRIRAGCEPSHWNDFTIGPPSGPRKVGEVELPGLGEDDDEAVGEAEGVEVAGPVVGDEGELAAPAVALGDDRAARRRDELDLVAEALARCAGRGGGGRCPSGPAAARRRRRGCAGCAGRSGPAPASRCGRGSGRRGARSRRWRSGSCRCTGSVETPLKIAGTGRCRTRSTS